MQYTTPTDKPTDKKFEGDTNGRGGSAKGMAEKVDNVIHDVGTSAMEKGKDVLHDLQDKTDEVTKDMKAFYADGAAILRRRVADQPVASIGIAMAAGALLSLMMFRR